MRRECTACGRGSQAEHAQGLLPGPPIRGGGRGRGPAARGRRRCTCVRLRPRALGRPSAHLSQGLAGGSSRVSQLPASLFRPSAPVRALPGAPLALQARPPLPGSVVFRGPHRSGRGSRGPAAHPRRPPARPTLVPPLSSPRTCCPTPRTARPSQCHLLPRVSPGAPAPSLCSLPPMPTGIEGLKTPAPLQ